MAASQRKVSITWREDRQRWMVRYYWEGKPITHFSWVVNGQKYTFYRDCWHWAEELQGFIIARMRPNEQGICTFHPSQIKTGRVSSPHSFSSAVLVFLRERENAARTGDRSSEYVANLKRYNRLYWTPKLGSLDVRDINNFVLKDYYMWLCTHGHSKGYNQNIMNALKTFLTEALEDTGLKCPKFPDYKVKKKDRTRRHKWLSEEEQDKVLACAPDVHKPIMTMIFYHGLRLIEARSLKWEHIDLKRGTAHIETRKGGPDRDIRLEPEVISLIKSTPRVLYHQFVFHKKGRPYTKIMIWRAIRNALDDAGFPDIWPNEAGRHSFGSQRTQRGQPSLSLKYEMGHSDVRTTEHYTHVKGGDEKWKRK